MKKNIKLANFNKNSCIPFHIRSFTQRNRKLTEKQKYALDNYWPKIGIEFRKEEINFLSFFGCDKPIIIEIGFGIGDSLISMANLFPDKNFIGIEVYTPGICFCLSSIYEKKIKNLRLIYHDAVEVFRNMIPNNSVDVIQLFFPDPWQKLRHNKRRIVQEKFAKLIKKKLKINGIFHIITDWKPYAKHILKTVSSLEGYKNQSKDSSYSTKIMSRPSTKFERRSYYSNNEILELIFKKVR